MGPPWGAGPCARAPWALWVVRPCRRVILLLSFILWFICWFYIQFRCVLASLWKGLCFRPSVTQTHELNFWKMGFPDWIWTKKHQKPEARLVLFIYHTFVHSLIQLFIHWILSLNSLIHLYIDTFTFRRGGVHRGFGRQIGCFVEADHFEQKWSHLDDGGGGWRIRHLQRHHLRPRRHQRTRQLRRILRSPIRTANVSILIMAVAMIRNN